MPIPRFWGGRLMADDFDPSFVLPMTSIAQGGLLPDKIGLPYTNKTGTTITAGTLLTVTGWDAATDRPSVTRATAGTLNGSAGWIALANVLNNASGTMGQHFSLTGQNTNAANVGDAVYLDTVAGGFTLTNPPAAPVVYQRVGTVRTKNATTGIVELRVLGQPDAVPLTQLSTAFPTIATTATTESCPIRIDRAGTILGVALAFNQALAASDSNFISWSCNNRTQTKALIADNTGGRNTTKVTGGTAVVQYGNYPLVLTLTPADLVVAASDVVTVSAVVTGTLANTLTGTVRLIHAPV